MDENYELEYTIEGKAYNQNDQIFKEINLNILYEKGICEKNKLDEIVFHFVGILTVERKVIVVLPKYISHEKLYLSCEDKLKIIIPIIKILKEYSNSKYIDEDDKTFLSNDISEHNVSEITICDSIIKDYLQYGVYEKYFIQNHLNGEGDIAWDSTIEDIDPLFSLGSPIYHDTYNRNTEYNGNNLITNINMWAIQYSFNKYGDLLGYTENLDFQERIQIGYLDDPEVTLNILQNELDEVYEDRKIVLLKTLIGLIKRVCNLEGSESYRFYGTKCFENVWEYVLKVVLEDQYYEYADQLYRAKWYDSYGCHICDSERTLIPDVIRIIKNKYDKERLYIFDAKYYNIKFNDKNIVNKPGMPDITKQFLYSSMLKKKLVIKKSFNAFLFPSEENYADGYKIAGKIKIKYFKSQRIIIIYVDTEKLYDHFLSGEKFNFEINCD